MKFNLLVLILIFEAFIIKAQDKNDIIVLKSGKILQGRVLDSKDTSEFNIMTDDSMNITVKKDKVLSYSISNKKIVNVNNDRVRDFNIKIGTKFITKIKTAKGDESTQEEEIVAINGNEYKIKLSMYISGGFQQNVFFTKMIWTEDTIKKANGTEDTKFDKGCDEWFIYPLKPIIGNKLRDLSAYGKLNVGGVKNISFRCNYTDIAIPLKESITTPAGTFDCFLMTYNTKIMDSKSILKVTSSNHSKCWYSSKVGVVKLELYDDKNNLISVSELENVY